MWTQWCNHAYWCMYFHLPAFLSWHQDYADPIWVYFHCNRVNNHISAKLAADVLIPCGPVYDIQYRSSSHKHFLPCSSLAHLHNQNPVARPCVPPAQCSRALLCATHAHSYRIVVGYIASKCHAKISPLLCMCESSAAAYLLARHISSQALANLWKTLSRHTHLNFAARSPSLYVLQVGRARTTVWYQTVPSPEGLLQGKRAVCEKSVLFAAVSPPTGNSLQVRIGLRIVPEIWIVVTNTSNVHLYVNVVLSWCILRRACMHSRLATQPSTLFHDALFESCLSFCPRLLLCCRGYMMYLPCIWGVLPFCHGCRIDTYSAICIHAVAVVER